jgi:serine/threonine-protein kinase
MNLPDGYFLQNKKYQLTHTIGQGGFGITYLGVWNTEVKGGLGAMKTKVPVCIKEYFFKDYCYRDKVSHAVKVHSVTGEKLFDKFKEKLIKEANILSEVHHPYIVNVLEVFEENNTAYIIMEYIKGCSLKYMLDKEGSLSENKVLKYIHQVGNALDFVHDKSIVHLDIKPSNILIDKDDNARLIDFGVSKRYDIDKQETSTTTLTLSKGFASIEQYDDEGTQNFSPRPDIYSLGATMYNLLTGVIPVESILRATKRMLPPSSYNANITQKTETAILKAMEVKPENRYPVVKEMLASLDIPPYEFTENNLVESRQASEDEHTEAIHTHSLKKKGDTDDERTISISASTDHKHKHPGRGSGSKRRKRRKTTKRILLTVVILLFTFLGYAVYSYLTNTTDVSQHFISGRDMPGKNDNPLFSGYDSPVDIDSIPNESVQDTLPIPENDEQLQATDNNQQLQPQTNHSSEQGALTKVNPASIPKTTHSQPAGTTAEKSADDSENVARLEKEYANLMSSARTKMKNNNYPDARVDLMAAAKIKTTDEIFSLIRQCEEEEEKAKIKERLAKYYVFNTIDFGNLKIVQDREKKLYGAINEKGEERIPCKYINVDKSSNGLLRAFMRPDRRYDIYDDQGQCLKPGVETID